MRISRSVEEWLETDSGDLRIYLECDERGVPVRVNSIRYREEDEDAGLGRVTKNVTAPFEVLERVVEILKQRRMKAGENRFLICAEHAQYGTGVNEIGTCGICHPEKVEELS